MPCRSIPPSTAASDSSITSRSQSARPSCRRHGCFSGASREGQPALGDNLADAPQPDNAERFAVKGADGKVFLVSQDGTVSVVSAAANWEILGVNALEDEVFATPAIGGGLIYVRTRNALYAFGK